MSVKNSIISIIRLRQAIIHLFIYKAEIENKALVKPLT